MANNNLRGKFINHLLKNGNKKTCEVIALKNFKEIQKTSKKSYKKVFKLAVVNTAPMFRITTLRKKRRKNKNFSKEVPSFVTKSFERISWSLKYILYFIKRTSSLKLYKKLSKEVLLNAQKKGEALNLKNEFQQKAVQNKRFLSHFRW